MREIQRNTRWVFELQDDGTVLHSSPHPVQADGAFNTEVIGHNFFDYLGGFDNMVDLERHFKSFVRSRRAAETFTVKCSSGSDAENAKVIMTRAYQTGYSLPKGVVMLEIRGN